MIELVEGLVNTVWHGDVNASFVAVPVEGEATVVERNGPVDGEFVVGLDGMNEMLGVRFGEAFDVEVLDTEDKCGASDAVLAPEARGDWHGRAAVGGQFLDQLVESNDAGFLSDCFALLRFASLLTSLMYYMSVQSST